MSFWNDSKEPPFRTVPYGTERAERTERQDQMDRIEAKLDTLIAALADEAEDQDQAPVIDLDGHEVPAERNQHQEL